MTIVELQDDLAPEAIEALARAKSAFLGAQAERCGYLRVAFERHEEEGELAVAASFTLKPKREWHHVDAAIKLADLEGQAMQGSVDRAFRSLSDAVACVGIAHLFRPMGRDAPRAWQK